MESTGLESTASATSSTDPAGNCQNEQQTLSIAEERVTVPSACIQCRNKHLKCDGLRPCSRCHSQGFQCTYLKSRRGYKGPSRNEKQASPMTALTSSSGCPLLPAYVMTCFDSRLGAEDVTAPVSSDTVSLQDSAFERVPEHSATTLGRKDQTLESSSHSGPTDVTKCRERCLEAFFQYFHDSHPFLPPKRLVLHMLRTRAVNHLETAMCYVGSQYVSTGSTVSFAQELDSQISDANVSKYGSMVQAMLLFAIGLDGRNEQKKALEVIFRAQDLALQLGMHQHDYAVVNGAGNPILEESWRRTWWELYIVDGIIAGLHQTGTFRLYEIASTVSIPCEEREYASGCLPPFRTIEEFEDLSFSDEDIQWSSYTYRISAIRNLGRILQLKEIVFPDDPLIDTMDAYLVNWKLHLPDSKKAFIDSDGQVDEMLFQAHMITNVSSILLHRQHSQLDTSAVQTITSCAPQHQSAPSFKPTNIHAVKTVQSAQNITKLIALPTSLIKHSHFFICTITLASIVHLSYWSRLTSLAQEYDYKQQICMNIGALKTMAEVWPSAKVVLDQVKNVAREVFMIRKAALDGGLWTDFANEEVMRGIIEDGSVMDSFN